MAKKRKERPESAADLRLAQPDRSGPSEKTLLQLAQERGLFDQAEQRQLEAVGASGSSAPDKLSWTRRRHPENFEDTDDGSNKSGGHGAEIEADEIMSPLTERLLETLLYTSTLTVLHVTLDVLVQNQFSIDSIVWAKVLKRTVQAFLVFGLLMYALHPHRSGSPALLPEVPERYKTAGRQVLFFAASICAGCYLVYISNTFGYFAIMKQAPPLGCLWIWSVIELDLLWALLSVCVTGGVVWKQGYSLM